MTLVSRFQVFKSLMSVYGGFATRYLEECYGKLLTQIVNMLVDRIVSLTPYAPEDGPFQSKLQKKVQKLVKLEEQKHLPPKLGSVLGKLVAPLERSQKILPELTFGQVRIQPPARSNRLVTEYYKDRYVSRQRPAPSNSFYETKKTRQSQQPMRSKHLDIITQMPREQRSANENKQLIDRAKLILYTQASYPTNFQARSRPKKVSDISEFKLI